jgi:adenosylcobinamide-GDP ribazoletransferase
MLLALKWTTLAALPYSAFAIVVIGAHMVSRWCAVGLIWGLRYVRSDENAKSKPLGSSVSRLDWLFGGLIGAAALVPAFLLRAPAAAHAILLACAQAAVGAVITAGLAAAYFKKRIGGYTGDCLGAVQQLTELTFLLVALAALVPPVRSVGL